MGTCYQFKKKTLLFDYKTVRYNVKHVSGLCSHIRKGAQASRKEKEDKSCVLLVPALGPKIIFSHQIETSIDTASSFPICLWWEGACLCGSSCYWSIPCALPCPFTPLACSTSKRRHSALFDTNEVWMIQAINLECTALGDKNNDLYQSTPGLSQVFGGIFEIRSKLFCHCLCTRCCNGNYLLLFFFECHNKVLSNSLPMTLVQAGAARRLHWYKHIFIFHANSSPLSAFFVQRQNFYEQW